MDSENLFPMTLALVILLFSLSLISAFIDINKGESKYTFRIFYNIELMSKYYKFGLF